jgi:hypothetical protein
MIVKIIVKKVWAYLVLHESDERRYNERNFAAARCHATGDKRWQLVSAKRGWRHISGVIESERR